MRGGGGVGADRADTMNVWIAGGVAILAAIFAQLWTWRASKTWSHQLLRRHFLTSSLIATTIMIVLCLYDLALTWEARKLKIIIDEHTSSVEQEMSAAGDCATLISPAHAEPTSAYGNFTA